MAPTAPIITEPTGGSVLTANTVQVSGTTEENGTVVLYDGETAVSTISASDGAWSTVVSLADGEHRLWANLGTADGTSDAGADVTVTVSGQPQTNGSSSDAPSPAAETEGAGDQDAPAEGAAGAPEVVPDASEPSGGTQIAPRADAELAAAEDPEAPEAPVIEVPHGGEELADNLVAVSGTAEPAGATVTVYADSRAIGTASVDDKGDWSLEANLPNAGYVLTAAANDAGRVSARSAEVRIVVNHDTAAEPDAASEDPEERFVQFIEEKILRGYPLRWELIQELRQHAAAWLEHRKTQA